MVKGDCNSCYFFGLCPEEELCVYYSPIYEEMKDSYIEELINILKEEYREAWEEYTREFEG